MRVDKFEAFLVDRQRRLIGLIEQAIGKTAPTGREATEERERT